MIQFKSDRQRHPTISTNMFWLIILPIYMKIVFPFWAWSKVWNLEAVPSLLFLIFFYIFILLWCSNTIINTRTSQKREECWKIFHISSCLSQTIFYITVRHTSYLIFYKLENILIISMKTSCLAHWFNCCTIWGVKASFSMHNTIGAWQDS